MIDAVKKAGGQPRMTIYPGVGHQCWEEAYGGQEFYDWLLSHRKGDDRENTSPDNRIK